MGNSITDCRTALDGVCGEMWGAYATTLSGSLADTIRMRTQCLGADHHDSWGFTSSILDQCQ